MEIDITHMIDDSDRMHMLSGSVCELGNNAGEITWNNSKDYAAKNILLKTPKEIEQAKKWFREFGAWEQSEITAWDDNEVNALLVQYIAGDIREMISFETYEDYQAESEAGTASGRIFKSGNKFYFYVGS